MKMESFRASYRLAMGRALVAAAVATPAGPARKTLVDEARSVAAALRQEWNPALIGHTLLIEAGIASLAEDGDTEPVVMALAAAIDVLDRQGRVRFVHRGFHGAESDRELRRQIDTLLAEKISSS